MENEECVFCLDELQKESVGYLDPCNHIFHMSCVLSLYDMDKTCPLCRKEINELYYAKKTNIRNQIQYDKTEFKIMKFDETLFENTYVEVVKLLDRNSDAVQNRNVYNKNIPKSSKLYKKHSGSISTFMSMVRSTIPLFENDNNILDIEYIYFIIILYLRLYDDLVSMLNIYEELEKKNNNTSNGVTLAKKITKELHELYKTYKIFFNKHNDIFKYYMNQIKNKYKSLQTGGKKSKPKPRPRPKLKLKLKSRPKSKPKK